MVALIIARFSSAPDREGAGT